MPRRAVGKSKIRRGYAENWPKKSGEEENAVFNYDNNTKIFEGNSLNPRPP